MPPTTKPGTIVRETLTLQQDLLNGLKISELERWTGDSEVRQLVLQNLVFGRIRWLKSNGKSLSAALNQGFTILHWTMIIKAAVSQEGVVCQKGLPFHVGLACLYRPDTSLTVVREHR
jgi:hypothetical protein